MRVPFFYGWVVVAVTFVTMAVGVNARTAFSLLFPPILDEFGWERGLTAGAFAFGFLVSTAFIPFLGRLMDRWGPRVVIPMGVVMTCAGLSLAMTPDGQRVACGGFMKALPVFHLGDWLAPPTLDPDDLCLWGEIVSGQRIEGGGVTNLTAEEWLQRWRDFRRRHHGQQQPGAR